MFGLLRAARWRASEAVRRRYGLRRRAPEFPRELTCVQDNATRAPRKTVTLVCCLSGGDAVQPFFLDYYRRLGVDRFFFIRTRTATERSVTAALEQPDCSIWTANADPQERGDGAFWVNALLNRFATGKLAVVVGCRDYLIYPRQTTRNLHDVLQFLNDDRKETMHAVIVEAYAASPASLPVLQDGDLFGAGFYFDCDGYIQSRGSLEKIVIQGGPSLRVDCAHAPDQAPELNCVPVVVWPRLAGYRYRNREMFPSYLNRAHNWGEVSLSGVLLRLPDPGREAEAPLFTPGLSVACDGWQPFVKWGLCTPGNWV